MEGSRDKTRFLSYPLGACHLMALTITEKAECPKRAGTGVAMLVLGQAAVESLLLFQPQAGIGFLKSWTKISLPFSPKA